MKKLTFKKRASLYNEKYSKWPDSHLRASERWIHGMWIMGNDYRGTGYYGSYPPGFLDRVMVMFPDAKKVLHLFSGSLKKSKTYTRFDLHHADVNGDAHRLSRRMKGRKFDLIIADPPYSEESCIHYGTPMINRNKVLKECAKALEKGGYVVWLDQVMPMFRKDRLNWCGAIGVCRSTNHRFRVTTIFKKVGGSGNGKKKKS